MEGVEDKTEPEPVVVEGSDTGWDVDWPLVGSFVVAVVVPLGGVAAGIWWWRRWRLRRKVERLQKRIEEVEERKGGTTP